jgi:ribosome-associated protein
MKVRVRRVSAERISVPITTEFIKLESFLKLANAAGSGGMAKNFIQNGEVEVNGETCTMRGKKLRPGDSVRFNGAEYLVADAAQ